jgi:hypothetical protein
VRGRAVGGLDRVVEPARVDLELGERDPRGGESQVGVGGGAQMVLGGGGAPAASQLPLRGAQEPRGTLGTGVRCARPALDRHDSGLDPIERFEHARDRLERERMERITVQRGTVVRERLLGLSRELEAAAQQRAVRRALGIAVRARDAALEHLARGRMVTERDEHLAVRAECGGVVGLDAERLDVEARGHLVPAAPARRFGARARHGCARGRIQCIGRDLERRARRELRLVVAAELRGEPRALDLGDGMAGRPLDRGSQQRERLVRIELARTRGGLAEPAGCECGVARQLGGACQRARAAERVTGRGAQPRGDVPDHRVARIARDSALDPRGCLGDSA